MLRKNPRGDYPEVHETAFVDPTAILCGKVIIHEGVFIGPYAVIRADETDEQGHLEPITIRAYSNIQDGVVIHSKDGALVDIGHHTSIAHRSIVHGPCVIGDHVFVGFNSVLFNCRVEAEVVIRHNCVIDGRDIPSGFYIPSTTKVNRDTDLNLIAKVTASASEFSESVIRTNVHLANEYRRIHNQF